MHRLEEVVRLHRLGRSAREVARLCGMSRKTVLSNGSILSAAGLWDGDPTDLPSVDVLHRALEASIARPLPRQQTSTIEKWMPAIEQLVDRGAGPAAIHDHLRLEHAEFAGSLSAVKRACARLRRERGVPRIRVRGVLYARVGRAPGTYCTMAGEVVVERAFYREIGVRNGPILDPI